MANGSAAQLVEILIGLLVFALGLPAFISIIAVNDSVRQIAHKHGIWRESLPIMFAILALVCAIVLSEESFLSRPDGETSPYFQETLQWLALILASCWVLLHWRGLLIRDVEVSLVQSIGDRCSSNLLDIGSVPRDLIDDLIALGEHSAPGERKALVLSVTKDLAEGMVIRLESKDADVQLGAAGLDDLVRGLPRILNNKAVPGSAENFAEAATLLTDVWRGLETRGFVDGSYGVAIVRVLSDLSLASMGKFSHTIIDRFLKAFPAQPGLHFPLGREALKQQRYPIAAAALNQLETIVRADSREEIVFDLAGLAAHFWCSGEPSRSRAMISLSYLDAWQGRTRDVLLEQASDYHYGSADLDTVECLQRLMKETKPRRPERNGKERSGGDGRPRRPRRVAVSRSV